MTEEVSALTHVTHVREEVYELTHVTHMREEVYEGVSGQCADSQGQEEVVGLVIVTRPSQGRQQHRAPEADAPDEQHRQHAAHPPRWGKPTAYVSLELN